MMRVEGEGRRRQGEHFGACCCSCCFRASFSSLLADVLPDDLKVEVTRMTIQAIKKNSK